MCSTSLLESTSVKISAIKLGADSKSVLIRLLFFENNVKVHAAAEERRGGLTVHYTEREMYASDVTMAKCSLHQQSTVIS